MPQREQISNKVLTFEQLQAVRAGLSDEGQTLVHCHGCFDIVHPGHIRHLQFAASQGDRLLVTVTADAFVNKGAGRPMFTHELRAENLAALEFVDWVCVHHEPTAVDLLAQIKPDVYIKGAEYASKNDPRFENEREVVEANCGRVVFSSGDVVFSSTSIVESIQSISRQGPDVAQFARLNLQHDLSSSNIVRTLEKAKGKRVAVVGETIIDTYTYCQWPEIAEEHPVLSLRPVSTDQYDGGAAIVAQHLASLGLCPVLFTPVPSVAEAGPMIRRLQAAGVEVCPIEVGTRLPEKIRYIVGHDKVMKLDCTDSIRFHAAQKSEVIDQLLEQDDLDGVVITDFGLGMFANQFAKELCERLSECGKLVVGDISGVGADLLAMRRARLLCPSELELRQAFDDMDSSVVELALRLLDETDSKSAVITRGSDGLVLVSVSGVVTRLPAMSFDPIDALGCGDALLASMCAMLLSDGFEDSSMPVSAYVGSVAAAVAGSVMGNSPVGMAEITKLAQNLGAQFAHSVSQIEHKSALPSTSEPVS